MYSIFAQVRVPSSLSDYGGYDDPTYRQADFTGQAVMEESEMKSGDGCDTTIGPAGMQASFRKPAVLHSRRSTVCKS